MSLVKKLVIIYCAENLISGKKYVGQTSRPLHCRMQQHFCSAKKANHKFAEALKYYSKESWRWYVLAEVECSKANEYEAFYIKDLNTYENGYNTQRVSSFENKINSTKYSSNVCSVYKPEIGTITGTKNELARLYPELEEVRHLLSGKRLHINGWVLSEYKDKYEEITSRRNRFGEKITLVHKEHGKHTLRQSEFVKNFGLNYCDISSLILGRLKSSKGWKLPSTEEPCRLENLTISLYHKDYGVQTLKFKEFRDRFNLNIYQLSKVARGVKQVYKGWLVIIEE